MYKIVDTFNGGEFGKFRTLANAKRELDKQYRQFRNNLVTKNCFFKRVIAPASAEWFFNHSRNRWEWTELTVRHND